MPIKYRDFNGIERAEDHYFHLPSHKVTTMQFADESGGDLSSFLVKIVEEGDIGKQFEWLMKIVLASYGLKDEEGLYFLQSDDISQKFVSSAAFEQLFNDIFYRENGDELLIKFINGMMPDIVNELGEQADQNQPQLDT